RQRPGPRPECERGRDVCQPQPVGDQVHPATARRGRDRVTHTAPGKVLACPLPLPGFSCPITSCLQEALRSGRAGQRTAPESGPTEVGPPVLSSTSAAAPARRRPGGAPTRGGP